MSTDVTYKELIGYVQAMISQSKTGTFFVRTDDNHSVVIGVREGDIVSLSCGPRYGMEAIPLIKRMAKGSYRLEDVAVDHHAEELPSTQKIIELLIATEDSGVAVKAMRAGHTSTQEQKMLDVSKAGKVLCTLLHDYLGPIAPMVCEEAVSATGGLRNSAELQSLIDHLANEIDDSEEAKSFTAQARDQLESMLS